MLNKIISIFLILTFFLGGCSSFPYFPSYLPSSDKVGVNQFGSYIKLELKNGNDIGGELIAADNSQIYVLIETQNDKIISKKTIKLEYSELEDFSFYYAKPENYYSRIALSLVSVLHGFWLVITLPLNLIVRNSVAIGSKNSFKYYGTEVNSKQLSQFARFPQGIPENIKFENIK
ncbi:MAG: hypothetical protein NTW25_12555 [Candidatus Kapabacteria bacterium]|nr:hypothetical protein [Candidatus Kapabacteria bacterium]